MGNFFRASVAAVCTAVILSACATTDQLGALPPVSLLGQQVDDAAATQVVIIHPNTKWTNIESGQIVRFMVGAKAFTWSFTNSQTIASFDLNRVTPPGFLDHRVTVYLTPDPKYTRR